MLKSRIVFGLKSQPGRVPNLNYCGNPVVSVLVGRAQIGWFYSHVDLSGLGSVYKLGGFYTKIWLFVPALFHALFTRSVSVFPIILPIIHSTNKGDNILNKLFLQLSEAAT